MKKFNALKPNNIYSIYSSFATLLIGMKSLDSQYPDSFYFVLPGAINQKKFALYALYVVVVFVVVGNAHYVGLPAWRGKANVFVRRIQDRQGVSVLSLVTR